jgi:hypothetical protein
VGYAGPAARQTTGKGFGAGFVLAPDQVLANYGIEHSPALALLGRLFGGALLTLGVILWLARDFRDEAAVRKHAPRSLTPRKSPN